MGSQEDCNEPVEWQLQYSKKYHYFILIIWIPIPGHPRRSKLGEIVILSLQHPYGESKQVEPIDK